MNATKSRSNNEDINCFDGNGEYQYLGRGSMDEDIPILLDRIDWLAKNNSEKSLYTTSFIVTLPILISTILTVYSYSSYFLSEYEIILIVLSTFISVFSILNLLQFHTDRYSDYYIRNNINLIRKKYNLSMKEDKLKNNIVTSLPHRTEIQDVLSL